MSKPTPAKPKKTGEEGKPLSFEQALHRLEEIVNQLETGEAPLESALKLYEEGVKLSRSCTRQLQDAERRVELLEDQDGQLRGKPFGGRRRAAGPVGEAEDDGTDDEEEGEDEDEDEAEDDEEAGDETEADDGEARGPGRKREGQEPLF
jgi:exodeoxyribonuclease VII small subunit